MHTGAAPQQPSGVQAVAGMSSVRLTWTAPGSFAPITNYVVTWYSNGAPMNSTSVGSANTSLTVGGLTNGTTYTFRVNAVNCLGSSSQSADSNQATPGVLPGAPGTPTTSAGNDQVGLGWNPPSDNHGPPITNYVITPYADGTRQSLIQTSDNTPSFTLPGLKNGTGYTFSVAAQNAAGVGPSSGLSGTATPAAGFATVLRDASGQYSLAVQLQQGQLDTGAFDFLVPSVGDYRGTLTIGQAVGQPDIRLSTDSQASFIATSGSGISTVSMHIAGSFTTNDSSASVTISIVGGLTYNLHTDSGSASGARAVAQQVGSAMASRDWVAVYGLMSASVIRGMTPSQFSQSMSGQGPTLSTLTLTGSGQLLTGRDGYTRFTQPFAAVAHKADGTTYSFNSTIYLVLEQGSWRVLGTDPAASS